MLWASGERDVWTNADNVTRRPTRHGHLHGDRSVSDKTEIRAEDETGRRAADLKRNRAGIRPGAIREDLKELLLVQMGVVERGETVRRAA